MLLSILIVFALLIAVVYFQWPLLLFWLGLVLLLSSCFIAMQLPSLAYLLLALFAIGTLVFYTPWLRRNLIARPFFHWFASIMPEMSKTERVALEAGTVGYEKSLFKGDPDFSQLNKLRHHVLSAEEKAFIDGPVKQLCKMIDDWQITHELHDMPPKIWDFLKKKGFFAMIIPKAYGGKAFSATAHGAIISRVAAVSTSVATTITVPNSIGPAELLLRYGTKRQRDYYLPRLAKGIDIPCFALTSPDAGSDATSIVDQGVIAYKRIHGVKKLGIKLNFSKRYITLAPVATVIGLAFKCYDPDHLLGDQEQLGITCALVPRDTPGVKIGERHFPLNCAFVNGPIVGQSVFIELDQVIGGAPYIGQGWKMLMECLAVGRAISLPSLAVGGATKAVWSTGGYARIRKQFKRPIGDFEGVGALLARMAGRLVRAEAMRDMTISMVDQGGSPALASAMSKYHCTELARKIIQDAMDIHGGKGICLGPKNAIGRLYQETPISITVEGANLLTRNMIIFGQGLLKGHPYLLAEINAIECGIERGLADFDRALWGHLTHIAQVKVKAFIYGLSRSRGVLIQQPMPGFKKYQQYLVRFSAAFAFLLEMMLLLEGGKLKQKERLSARLGDCLSYLYQISALLRLAKKHRKEDSLLRVIRWSLDELLASVEQSLDRILRHMRSRWLAVCVRFIIFPWGRHCQRPKDHKDKMIAGLVQSDIRLRRWLASPIHTESSPLKDVADAWNLLQLNHKAQQKLNALLKEGIVSHDDPIPQQIKQAEGLKRLTASDAKALLKTYRAIRKVSDVDAFVSL